MTCAIGSGQLAAAFILAALAECRKRRRARLGNPRLADAALIQGWRCQEWTLRRISSELSLLNIPPPAGSNASAGSVRNQLAGGAA